MLHRHVLCQKRDNICFDIQTHTQKCKKNCHLVHNLNTPISLDRLLLSNKWLFKNFEVTRLKVRTSLEFDHGHTKNPLQCCPQNHFKLKMSFNHRCLVFQNNSHLPDCLGSVFFSCGSTCFNLLWSKVFTSALVSAASSLISKTTSFSLNTSCGRSGADLGGGVDWMACHPHFKQTWEKMWIVLEKQKQTLLSRIFLLCGIASILGAIVLN